VPSADGLAIRAFVNGELCMCDNTSNLHRGVAQLIADVTEFMTLRAGDVLTVGVPGSPPLARAGDLMAVEIEGIGRLENRLVSAAALYADAAP
jgi:5-oxopent-3-ene-1,2,5-tricarboxylate decarboxylase/2-hydroxyhepta-2,4-diene-1,7-dioate isomerase